MVEAMTIDAAHTRNGRLAATLAAKVCFLACALLVSGASAQDSRPAEGRLTAVAPRSSSRSSGGEILVATVGDAQLTLRTLQRLIQPRLRDGVKRLKVDRDKEPERYRALKRSCEEQILSEWLAVTLLAHQARIEGLSLTSAEAREAMASIERKVAEGGGDSLFDMARESGMDPGALEWMIREALLGDKYIRSLIRKTVSEEGLRQIYNKNPGAYVIQPWRRHLHCFTAMRSDGLSARGLRGLLADAQRKIERGADAAQVAAEIRTGSIEIVEEAQLKQVVSDEEAKTLIEEIERYAVAYDMWIMSDFAFKSEKLTKAAFDLEVGRNSGVINLADGYYLLSVVGEEQARGTNFEECRTVVEDGLMGKLREPLAIKALESLKGRTQINRRYLTQVVDEETSTDDSDDDMFQKLLRIRGERAKKKARERRALEDSSSSR